MRFLRVSRVAALAGVARQTAYEEIKSGRLRAAEIAGHLLVSEDDAAEYARARREQSGARQVPVDRFALAAAIGGPVLL